MSSIAKRLTRSYCLFHLLSSKPIVSKLKNSLIIDSLDSSLNDTFLNEEVTYSDLPKEGADFDQACISFMVRQCGLTWSTCSLFYEAMQEKPKITRKDVFLVCFSEFDPLGNKGLPRVALVDLAFLSPRNIVNKKLHISSLEVHWDKTDVRRLRRYLRLIAARNGVDATVYEITQSKKFLENIIGTVGAK